MASQKQQSNAVTRGVTIRWPEDLWEIISIEVTKRRTSMQALVTEAVTQYLGLPAASSDQQNEQAGNSGPKTRTA